MQSSISACRKCPQITGAACCCSRTHPVCCQDLGGEWVAQGSKAPELIGDVLPTKDRDVQQDAVVNEVQQLAVAHIQLGQGPANGGQILQSPADFCKRIARVMLVNSASTSAAYDSQEWHGMLCQGRQTCVQSQLYMCFVESGCKDAYIPVLGV